MDEVSGFTGSSKKRYYPGLLIPQTDPTTNDFTSE